MIILPPFGLLCVVLEILEDKVIYGSLFHQQKTILLMLEDKVNRYRKLHIFTLPSKCAPSTAHLQLVSKYTVNMPRSRARNHSA